MQLDEPIRTIVFVVVGAAFGWGIGRCVRLFVEARGYYKNADRLVEIADKLDQVHQTHSISDLSRISLSDALRRTGHPNSVWLDSAITAYHGQSTARGIGLKSFNQRVYRESVKDLLNALDAWLACPDAQFKQLT